MKKFAFLGVFAGIFIGFAFVVMSHVTKTVHPLVYSVYVLAITIPFLIVISHFFTGRGLRETIKEDKKDFFSTLVERFIIGSGILIPFGVSMSLAIRTVFVIQIEPLFVLLWSAILLKEKISKNKLIMIGSLLLGAFLITTGGNTAFFGPLMVGDLLVILALVFFSHTYITSSNLMKKSNPIRIYLGFSVFSLIFFLAITLIFLPPSAFLIGWLDFGYVFLAGLLFNIIGFPLWLISLKHMRPWELASTVVIETVAGALLALIWLGQSFTLIQALGGMLILISIYIINSRKNHES